MKFAVTQELAKLLKALRTQNDISGKGLSEYIGKSPSYISKLESGAAKFIQETELTKILVYNSGGGDFYEEVLPNAVKLLYSFMEPARITDQIWLIQYDVMERKIHVPAEMAEDILKHLNEEGITIAELVATMDGNFDTELSADFESSEVISIAYEDRSRLLIHIDVSQEEVEAVLSGEKSETEYYCLYSLVHSIFRMFHFPGETKKLPSESAILLFRLTATYLDQWGIRTLTNFSHMLLTDDFINHQTLPVNVENKIINQISDRLTEIARYDPLKAARQLNVFYDTLNWDAAFAMKIMGLTFSELGDISFQNKKKLLGEIQSLLEKYDQMSEFEKKLESY